MSLSIYNDKNIQEIGKLLMITIISGKMHLKELKLKDWEILKIVLLLTKQFHRLCYKYKMSNDFIYIHLCFFIWAHNNIIYAKDK